MTEPTITQMRARALELGFRIEKVQFEDRWLIRYAENGAGTPGNLAHHEFQDCTTAKLREWLS